MKVLFLISSSMEKPSPSWHLMKALLEDVLNQGVYIHAIQEHFTGQNNLPFPKEILENDKFSYSGVKACTVNKKNLALRYFNGIWYALKMVKHIRKHNDFDVVFVQSTPTSLYTILVARLLAGKRPIIYNSQDMFPGSAIANGSMSNKLMQKVFYFLQKIAYSQVDTVTAISEDMKQKLIEQGVPDDKVEVIVNWYDDAAVHEIKWENNKFVKKYDLSPQKFYVQYAGTMGTNFNPKIILDVAEKLKDYKNIEFQMIGNGVRKDKFMADAKQRRLDNIVFYPLQSQDMVSDVYSACSLCLIPLQKGVIGNSVPSKAALLMACRRVIINSVDADSDYAQMFDREKIGCSADVDEVDKIADYIIDMYDNPNKRLEYADNAKKYGTKYYSRKYNTMKYVNLFKRIAGK